MRLVLTAAVIKYVGLVVTALYIAGKPSLRDAGECFIHLFAS